MRLYELRRNPHQNKKQSPLEQLLQYQNKEVYISFQRIEKLGLNPNFDYSDSPLGIYAYYLPAVIDDMKKLGAVNKSLPFGSTRPYIFVFEVRGANILNIKDYTEKNLETDLKKLKSDIEKTFVEQLPEFKEKIAGLKTGNSPAEILYLTLQHLTDFDSIQMRKYFLKLGYDGVVDTIGTKATFPLEIKEAVFFSKQHINVIDMIRNFKSDDDDVIYKDGEEYEFDPFDEYEHLMWAPKPTRRSE
jgi:hypothetical protein